MMSRHRLTTNPVPRALRLGGLAAIVLVGSTCRDRGPMGPGLPSRATLAVAPQLQQAALTGGPSFVSMRSVHGVLTPIGGGVSYSADAAFDGDTAALEFNVTFAGPTQRYSLALAATDTAGDTLFRSMRDIVATPGNNDPVSDVLTYAAPDSGVRTILIVPADTIVLGGDTLAVAATGFDANKAAIAPLYLGWTSRDTSVATVISGGPSLGRVIGRSIESPVWIVGRAFNGAADSVSIRVALKVGSVVLAADTVHLSAGAVATVPATVLDASGGMLDRPVSFVSLDTSVVTAGALLGVSSPVAQLTGIRAGTTKLVASSGGKADTAMVIVDPVPIATVQMIPDSIVLLPGDSGRFNVVLLGAAGDTLSGRAITWRTGSPSVTTVSATGTLTGIAVGRTFVTATAEGIVDTAWVNVVTTGTSVVRTVVSPKTLHLLSLGATAQLVAQGYAGDSSLVPGRYSWSVRQQLPLLAVDSLGGVTALAVGTAWVVATEKGGTADSAQVTVEQLLPVSQPLGPVALPMRSTGASVRATCSPFQAEAPCRRQPTARSASSFAERAKRASATRIPWRSRSWTSSR